MPFYDIDTEDIRCGWGASKHGPGTQTATVVAGDEVGFVIGRSADEVCRQLSGFIIESAFNVLHVSGFFLNSWKYRYISVQLPNVSAYIHSHCSLMSHS